MSMEIAQRGKGMYVRADNSNSAVQALVAQLDELETTTTSSLSYSEYDEKFTVFAWILLAIIFFWLFWIHIPAKMARKRGRSGLGWVLLTWVDN